MYTEAEHCKCKFSIAIRNSCKKRMQDVENETDAGFLRRVSAEEDMRLDVLCETTHEFLTLGHLSRG